MLKKFIGKLKKDNFQSELEETKEEKSEIVKLTPSTIGFSIDEDGDFTELESEEIAINLDELKSESDEILFVKYNDLLTNTEDVEYGQEMKSQHLLSAKRYNDNLNKDPIACYFELCSIYDKFYKFREEPEIKELLLKNVTKQVELFLSFESEENYPRDKEEFPSMLYTDGKWDAPLITCFKNYIIIHEKNGMLKEALDVCNKGIELGYANQDGTKGGLERRRNTLEKKIASL